MLRNMWNFHGDIAIQLEGDARIYYGWTDRPFTTIYDADSIEQGSFAECMIILLREKSKYSCENDTIDAFVNECGKYIGQPGSTISAETADSLYNEFERLFDAL